MERNYRPGRDPSGPTHLKVSPKLCVCSWVGFPFIRWVMLIKCALCNGLRVCFELKLSSRYLEGSRRDDYVDTLESSVNLSHHTSLDLETVHVSTRHSLRVGRSYLINLDANLRKIFASTLLCVFLEIWEGCLLGAWFSQSWEWPLQRFDYCFPM